MMNRLSNPINRNRSAAKISKVMSSSGYPFSGKNLLSCFWRAPILLVTSTQILQENAFQEKFTAGIFLHDCWSRQISTLNRIFPNFKSTTFHLYSRAKDGLESWKLGVVRLVALPAGCLSRQVASSFSSNASSWPKWWIENHLGHLQLISLIVISHQFHQTYHHHINIIMTTIMMIFQHWFWFECKVGAFIWISSEPLQSILRTISAHYMIFVKHHNSRLSDIKSANFRYSADSFFHSGRNAAEERFAEKIWQHFAISSIFVW